MRNDKADQEILFNALLAAKANIDAALREARLLVDMPEPPSEREKVLRELFNEAKGTGNNERRAVEFRSDLMQWLRSIAHERGITLDGDGNG